MKKVLVFLATISFFASAADYFPVGPNHIWVYDVIYKIDGVPQYVGNLVYRLGQDTMCQGKRYYPRILDFFEPDTQRSDTQSYVVGYLTDQNPIMCTDKLSSTANIELQPFYLQHSFSDKSLVYFDDCPLKVIRYGKFETPYQKYKNCISISDTGGRAAFIIAPDVGVVGVKSDDGNVVLKYFSRTGMAQLAAENMALSKGVISNNPAVSLSNGKLRLPATYSGPTKFFVYSADGKLLVKSAANDNELDISQSASGKQMLIVKVVLGNTVFSTRISVTH